MSNITDTARLDALAEFLSDEEADLYPVSDGWMLDLGTGRDKYHAPSLRAAIDYAMSEEFPKDSQ